MRIKTILWSLAMAGLLIAPAGLTAKKANPFKAGKCLRCHSDYATPKDDGFIMGNWVNRSRKAKTLTVNTGARILILKWNKQTKVKNAPSIHKLKKGMAVRIKFDRQGKVLVAKTVFVKPKFKLPKKMVVTPKQLYKLIKAGKVKKLVDSRPGFLYIAGTIPGAISIPFPKMKKMRGKLPKDKNALIVFFCQGFR